MLTAQESALLERYNTLIVKALNPKEKGKLTDAENHELVLLELELGL